SEARRTHAARLADRARASGFGRSRRPEERAPERSFELLGARPASSYRKRGAGAASPFRDGARAASDLATTPQYAPVSASRALPLEGAEPESGPVRSQRCDHGARSDLR